MNPTPAKSKLATTAVVAILVLSLLSILSTPAHAVTTQTVDISSAISGQAQWITYDSANKLAWISVGVSQNNLYKVNVATVLVQGTGAVTGYPSIFGNSACTGFGSVAQGVTETVILGGNIYATYWCSVNAIGVAQIRESDGAVLNTWTYSGPTDAQGLATDGSLLYVCAQGKILSLTTSGTYSLLHTVSNDCVNLILVGSILWFSEGSTGIGKINTDGSGFSELGCGGCSTAYFLASQGSNTWFTDSVAHNLIKYDGSSFTSYSTGLSTTGPYGLTYDSANNGYWLSGYANNKIRFFSLGSLAIDGTKDITTSKKPFQGFVDGTGNTWNIALGSTDLIEILSPTSTTSTTSAVTSSSSTASTTTKSTSMTQTSSTSSTSTTQTSASSTTTNTSSIAITTTTTSSTATDAGCVIGSKCAGHWTPIVIPFIYVNSIVQNPSGTATITGFEAFLSGPSSGDFLQWVSVVGCCAYEMSSLNPSNGTFATMSVTARPYNTNNYPGTSTPSLVLNVTLTPTSTTQFGWFCNNDHITQYVWQCDGNANPVNYRTFSLIVPTHTIVTIEATGTQSDGQAFVYNIFT